MNETPRGGESNRAGNGSLGEVVSVSSIESLQSLIRQSDSVLAVGRQTKPPLAMVDPRTTLVSTRELSGIVEYEPSEFTFTALAGTTIDEIDNTLQKRNQYLPFDPVLIRSGATLGGTVAAGTSGPGRHRFGGVRDFILGADFIDGDGTLIRSGGKVVKNAAGFDVPKLLVGSCGRLGVMTSLTFKVFPRPVERHTYTIYCDDHQAASSRIAAIARGRWELDAIDYRATTRQLWIRVGAERHVSDAIVADIAASVEGVQPVPQQPQQARELWEPLSELNFGNPSQDTVIKLPLTLRHMRALADWCDGYSDDATFHVSVAGALGWLAIAAARLPDLNRFFNESQMTGLVLSGRPGDHGGCLVGSRDSAPIEAAVKTAMDPPRRFPPLPH